jgi:hypothetical protein
VLQLLIFHIQNLGVPMQTVIIRNCPFNRGLDKFEKLVNDHIEKGWLILDIQFSQSWLQTICMAIMCNHIDDTGDDEPGPKEESPAPTFYAQKVFNSN